MACCVAHCYITNMYYWGEKEEAYWHHSFHLSTDNNSMKLHMHIIAHLNTHLWQLHTRNIIFFWISCSSLLTQVIVRMCFMPGRASACLFSLPFLFFFFLAEFFLSRCQVAGYFPSWPVIIRRPVWQQHTSGKMVSKAQNHLPMQNPLFSLEKSNKWYKNVIAPVLRIWSTPIHIKITMCFNQYIQYCLFEFLTQYMLHLVTSWYKPVNTDIGWPEGLLLVSDDVQGCILCYFLGVMVAHLLGRTSGLGRCSSALRWAWPGVFCCVSPPLSVQSLSIKQKWQKTNLKNSNILLSFFPFGVGEGLVTGTICLLVAIWLGLPINT